MKASSGLVGRASDRATVERRFDEEGARLVTLLGPPGIGKTALARAIGEDRRAVVVVLDGVSDAEAAADRIVVACGHESGAAEAVLREMGDRLVIVDGVDVSLRPLLALLVDRAPEAMFLATARERLGIEGEIVHELGPLDVTNGDAVEVVVAAARRAAHAWSPRAEDVPHLVTVARALDGIPLALELAGARLPLVGAPLLAREPPSPLAAVVERTLAALDPTDRATLAQLSAFASGFDVTSAAAVLGVDTAESATRLDHLRSRALLRTRDATSARFDLYREVRTAAARLEPAQAASARERHTTYFVTEAERAALRSHHDASARAWLVSERDEIMSVIERVATSTRPTARDAEQALRATVALSSVLLVRGPIGAVAAIVSPLVEGTRDSGADPRLSARVTALRGAIRRERGDVRSALKDLLAAESIARALADELLAADILVELGRTVLAAGEIAAARDHFDRAARAHAALGARGAEAHATALLGATLGILRDIAGARAMLERASALAASDRFLAPETLVLLARACAEGGDAASATAALDEAVSIASVEHDVRAHGDALVLRGVVMMEGGDVDRASEAWSDARDRFAANGLPADAAIARGWLGVAARARGRSAEAYALLADARDVCRRGARPAHAVVFGVFLAALDEDVGRHDAATSALDALATEAAASVEHASAWPPPARALVEAARSKHAAANDPLHVRLLARASAMRTNLVPPPPPPPEDALVVGEGGAWFRPPAGTRVGLERRKSLALLLDHLAAVPGTSVDATKLFAAAWPGERALSSAAAHRVRVGIATLRKLGLRDLLVTTEAGYSLTADVPVIRV